MHGGRRQAGDWGGAASANLIVSAAGAGAATVLILGSIALLAVLRREHTWSPAGMHGNLDAAPEDEPFTNAQSAQADDFDADDDEDPNRA